MSSARLPALFRRSAAGRSGLSRESLAINLSHVLHDRSTSNTVRSAVEAAGRQQRQARKIEMMILDGPGPFEPDAWVAPSIGESRDISMALSRAGFGTASIQFIDQDSAESTETQFFRAPARLTLPGDDVKSVGIAALIIRPGSHSHLLAIRGPFTWPDETLTALRAVEAVIQAHVEKWRPGTRLWDQPFEAAHPDEVQ